MRWMWIDRIVELVPRTRIVTVKNISLAEEHLHDHFAPDTAHGSALPLMPGSLIIEGMAQSAGILVGQAGGFKQKVVLAKVNNARLDRDAAPGSTLRYTATLERYDGGGASTKGLVEMIEHQAGGSVETSAIGTIDLLFSHLDQNLAGAEFPEHNFVFSESFRTILRSSGFEAW